MPVQFFEQHTKRWKALRRQDVEAPRRVQPERAQCEVEGDDRDEQPVAIVVDDTGTSTRRRSLGDVLFA